MPQLPAGEFAYVYVLESALQLQRYVGFTENLTQRLAAHNAGAVPHTSKFLPWKIKTAIAFRDRDRAVAFEKYLKTHAGRSFAAKRL